MERWDLVGLKNRLVTDKFDVAFIAAISLLLVLTVATLFTGNEQKPAAETESAVSTTTDASLGGLLLRLSDPLQITSPAEVARLPRPTAQSFKDYLTTQLQASKPDRQGCITAYTITRISSVNVAGSVGKINPKAPADESNSCGKAQRFIWVNKNGIWNQLPYVEVPKCTELAGTDIYKEFIAYCNDGMSYGDQKENPNGSLKDSAR